jgi:hypothetical protein
MNVIPIPGVDDGLSLRRLGDNALKSLIFSKICGCASARLSPWKITSHGAILAAQGTTLDYSQQLQDCNNRMLSPFSPGKQRLWCRY